MLSNIISVPKFVLLLINLVIRFKSESTWLQLYSAGAGFDSTNECFLSIRHWHFQSSLCNFYWLWLWLFASLSNTSPEGSGATLSPWWKDFLKSIVVQSSVFKFFYQQLHTSYIFSFFYPGGESFFFSSLTTHMVFLRILMFSPMMTISLMSILRREKSCFLLVVSSSTISSSSL